MNFSHVNGALISNVYVFATYTSLTGTFANVVGLTPDELSNATINYSYNGLNEIALTLTPEPSALTLVAFGLAGALLLRRRKS